MKTYVIAALLIGVAACSSGEGEKASTQDAAPAQPPAAAPKPVPTGKGTPAYTLENNLEDFWVRADGDAKDSLRSDHEGCQASAPKNGPTLIQLKSYIDCMGTKGWKQEPKSWERLRKESAAQAAR